MTLASLKNKYKGNRIFVIGNGKSLINTPLNLIKNEYSFGINRIGMLFDKTDWRPTHFLCVTHRVKWSDDYKADVMKVINSGAICFIGQRIRKDIEERENIHYITCLHIHDNPETDWWEDISNGSVSVFGQSLFGAVRIANFLGFNPIYLLGVDGGYTNTGKKNDENHFDPNYEIKRHRASKKKIDEWHTPRIHASHQMMARMAEKYNFEIYNATLNTKINYYPLVNFMEIMSDN